MLEFEDFIEEIKGSIKEYLCQYPIEKIEVSQMLKNNGVVETGLIVRMEESQIAPNIYLEYYYKLYKDGKDISEILSDITEAYLYAWDQVKDKEYTPYNEEQIQKKLFVRLVNQAQNEEFLKEYPHIPYLDLAITFRYVVLADGDKIGSAIVSYDDMARWGYDLQTLYKYALGNMRAMFCPKLLPLDEMLAEKFDELGIEDAPEASENLYVLTNEFGMNGASFMLYEDILNSFSVKMNQNFYILPSSIHEVLLVPDIEGVDVGFLADTVREVNAVAVAKMEYLSDSVYYYDSGMKRVSICG